MLQTEKADGVVRRVNPKVTPSPWSAIGLRNMVRFTRAPLAFLQATSEKFGDYVEVPMPIGQWVLVSHPSDIESILVDHAADVGRDEYARVLQRALGKGLLTSDGDLWKRQRRLSSAAFTPKRIRGYAAAMARVTDLGLRRWRSGEVMNLHEEISHLTMEVVADVLFGASVAAKDAVTVRDAVATFSIYFAQSPEAVLRIAPWVPTPLNRAMNKASREIDALIYGIIDARRKVANGRGETADLLDALLGATDEDGSRMSDEQLRDEVVTLFLAGHETTALAMSHALYLLAKHPAVARRVDDELHAVLRGALPTEADVPRLGILDRVVKEAMRLYPPAWVTGRAVNKPFDVAGHTVVPGKQLVMSQWLVHRDPRWYPHPEVFDPDRFEPEAVKARPRFSYFPFGGGPRVCIGNHFAMMEAVIMLAIILQRFRIEILPFEELRFAPAVTLRPKGSGIRVRVASTVTSGTPAVRPATGAAPAE